MNCNNLTTPYMNFTSIETSYNEKTCSLMFIIVYIPQTRLKPPHGETHIWCFLLSFEDSGCGWFACLLSGVALQMTCCTCIFFVDSRNAATANHNHALILCGASLAANVQSAWYVYGAHWTRGLVSKHEWLCLYELHVCLYQVRSPTCSYNPCRHTTAAGTRH